MKVYLPLLFLSFAFFGSAPLALNYFAQQIKIRKILWWILAVNFISLMLICATQNWQSGTKFVFYDSIGVFVICMGLLSYALPLRRPLYSDACKLILLNFGTLAFIISTFFFLYLTAYWDLFTRDALLYSVDLSLGFDPVAWLMQHLNAQFIFVCNIVYVAIPFTFLLVCADFYQQSKVLPYDLILQCLIASIIAWGLFFIIPAAGPVYAFPGVWQKTHAALAPSLMIPISNSTPRNCMPSLHAAWIYLIWCAVQNSTIKFRGVMFVLFVLTLIGTLTSGEHYLIDVLLGLVFAMGILAAYQRRVVPFICYVILYLLGMGLLIFIMLK